ncbi:MAG: hypothetical protein ABFD92_05105 [Planctomycetaceae bacterium]
MLGLRLIEGVSRSELSARFGADPVEAFPNTVARYASQRALVVTGETIHLAGEYLFVADTILADIITEPTSTR